jgi:hypothetical protein
MCVCDSEERERGVGAGVNATMLSATLEIISLTASAASAFRVRRKTMNLFCLLCINEAKAKDETYI